MQETSFGGEKMPAGGDGVTFTLLKLLRYPAKVGLLHGKSYSITGRKLNYSTTKVFVFSVCNFCFLTLCLLTFTHTAC